MGVNIFNEGSIVLVAPRDRATLEWLSENVQPDAQWWGGALVVEPRYLEDLLAGLTEAGLTEAGLWMCPYGHADCTPADCKDGEQPCPHSWVQHNPLDEYSSSHCEWCGEWRTGSQGEEPPEEDDRSEWLDPREIDEHGPPDSDPEPSLPF